MPANTDPKRLPTPRESTEWERDVRERIRLLWEAIDAIRAEIAEIRELLP